MKRPVLVLVTVLGVLAVPYGASANCLNPGSGVVRCLRYEPIESAYAVPMCLAPVAPPAFNLNYGPAPWAYPYRGCCGPNSVWVFTYSDQPTIGPARAVSEDDVTTARREGYNVGYRHAKEIALKLVIAYMLIVGSIFLMTLTRKRQQI